MTSTTTLTCRDAMRELESMGTAQNRKVYARHGVTTPMFGVSYANIGKLQKKIKRDHALALELWATGNHDARILATKIADPDAMKRKELESWAKDLDSYVIVDAFSQLAAASPFARTLSDKWCASKGEWTGAAGWNVVGQLAMMDAELPDDFFLRCLGVIEKEIHGRKNRVRHSMNGAMIAIGSRNERLKEAALATATKVGRVAVDHGETGCKTPHAPDYIAKMWARKKSAE
ncbi:MAG: DNA alkylation repair protein [Phycisphaerae bacterium]|nr:DNA alkylation repair protein [Phycisphaerae bacterium]